MGVPIIAQLIELSVRALPYVEFHFSGSADDALRFNLNTVRSEIYRRRIPSLYENHQISIYYDELHSILMGCQVDCVALNGDVVDLKSTHLEIGREYIARLSSLGIPFDDLPEFFMTKANISNAISSDPFLLSRIPANLCENNSLLAAISRAGFALGWLDIDSRTYDLCLKAVESHPEAIAMIPVFMLDEKIVKTALLGNPYFALMHIPAERITREMVADLLDFEPELIFLFDESQLDEEMVIKAVIAIPSLLTKIPRKFLTAKLYEALVEKHPGLIAIVPVERMSDKMLIGVIQKKPLLISAIPLEARTPAVCAVAHRASKGEVDRHIPAEIRISLQPEDDSDFHGIKQDRSIFSPDIKNE